MTLVAYTTVSLALSTITLVGEPIRATAYWYQTEIANVLLAAESNFLANRHDKVSAAARRLLRLRKKFQAIPSCMLSSIYTSVYGPNLGLTAEVLK